MGYGENFSPYTIINYKNILLLHLIYDSYNEDSKKWIDKIVETVCQYGNGYTMPDETEAYQNRFGQEDKSFLSELLNSKLTTIQKIKPDGNRLKKWLKEYENAEEFKEYFLNEFTQFSDYFYEKLNEYNLTKRSRLTHDLAINLKTVGICYYKPTAKQELNLEHIYTIAETINRIIKLLRIADNGKIKVVIDSLKNSLELMYFKEKYSSFYMVAVNTEEADRQNYVYDLITNRYGSSASHHAEKLLSLDKNEYKGDEFNSGKFTSPDIENCIQKSDYHIYHSDSANINILNEKLLNIHYQITKLLTLISQPGIITPTPMERTMQVAFNAKYNSGCISRQVGAVVCDENYSIKAIGWNDVAEHQLPCKLRNAEDFRTASNPNKDIYSEYELSDGEFNKGGKPQKFSELFSEDLNKAKVNNENLEGRNCSFCFKTFQNAYEGEKNQVHTRSLHAEENAMLQISKYGGMGLKNGYLFTTASPCELCSKKAFQIGVKKIIYIDPYPGIARTHTLQNGIAGKGNPELEMFRGAVGRAYHKLYEPFISYKDEIKILTEFGPTKL